MSTYFDKVESHLHTIITTGLAEFGPDPTPMWLASLDIRTGRYPTHDERPAHIGKRVYRNIDAPKGVSLYWDQPSIVAAYVLAELRNQAQYRQAVEVYIQAFLERCIGQTGLFLWGNHYYFDVFQGRVMWFKGEETPKPCDVAHDPGILHEIRPLPPAWESFWRVSPLITEKAIRAIAHYHLYDQASGGFNRHADQRRDYAFIEAGGILAETMVWLGVRIGDPDLIELALRVARYSFEHRGRETGLLENSPTKDRWDKYVCTTEVGLWAGSLLRAYSLSKREAFLTMAHDAVRAYLHYGYDSQAQQYYGRLNVADGKPDLSSMVTPYQPDTYADIWNALFPIHDYPMALANSAVTLFELTEQAVFAQAVERWVEIVRRTPARPEARTIYAEQYGRCIYFLLRAAQVFKRDDWLALAKTRADQAIAHLFAAGMFRGHTGEDRYDAVDGVGYLLLALIYLETGQESDLMGFGF